MCADTAASTCSDGIMHSLSRIGRNPLAAAGAPRLSPMATPRSSGGHTIVAVLLGLTALAHVAVALTAGPTWARALSGLLAVVAAVLLVIGLRAPQARFGGDGEDSWLVACAATGAVGVASALALTLLSFSGGGRTGLWSLAPLLVDALTVRVAVFTLRRVPAGR